MSAIAAVVVAIVAVLAFAVDVGGGSAEADDAVHLRLVQEPLVSDLWTLPGRVSSDPPPAGTCTQPELIRRRRWFQAHGGLPTGQVVARVEVINDSDSTLLVEGLHLSSAEELPPLQGNTYSLCPNGGGGPPEDQYARIDFDESPPRFEFFNELYQPVGAVDFSPSPHHPLRFWLFAYSESAHFRWRASLEYSLDGDIHWIPIPGGDGTFEIGNTA
ncbi:MAG TPA: hypothetical protein VF125_07520 [Solirubrobacterales bacterium]